MLLAVSSGAHVTLVRLVAVVLLTAPLLMRRAGEAAEHAALLPVPPVCLPSWWSHCRGWVPSCWSPQSSLV